MDIQIAQRIIDEKPTEAAHLYIDEESQPRDRHIENLFRDLYGGGPLDDIFRNNFEVYYQELISSPGASVKPGIFIDAGYAKRWVDQHIGEVTVRPMNKRELAREAADPERRHLKYVARINSHHAKRVPAVYAPSELSAVLLAAVFVYRAEATKRLKTFFREALRG